MSRAKGAVIAALLALGLGAIALVRLGTARDPRLCEALARADLRTVVTTGDVALDCAGVRTLRDPAVEAALRASDPAALLRGLRKMRALGVAVDTGASNRGLAGAAGTLGRSVGERLGRLEHVPGLQWAALGPGRGVVGVSPDWGFSQAERDATAYVARALFRGAREPSPNSFPAALRRVVRVEVMVALVERGEPRLWRSARGTSIARALLTATRVARERWREREAAMGGPLSKRLDSLDVEVSLLQEDGTLTRLTQDFVDRAVSKAHGLGIDYRTDWHYSLPTDVQRKGRGSPFRALSALVVDRGLPATVLTQPGARIYRFIPVMLGASRVR